MSACFGFQSKVQSKLLYNMLLIFHARSILGLYIQLLVQHPYCMAMRNYTSFLFAGSFMVYPKIYIRTYDSKKDIPFENG